VHHERQTLTVSSSGVARPWSEAWEEALYGADGFFLRENPLLHFRTNVAVPLFATAVRRMATRLDSALGFPDPFDVVDLGAGRGELLAALSDVPPRWRLTGVELADADVPYRWLENVPTVQGLLLANEWLDSVPLDVVEDGCLVLVSPDGSESRGAPYTSEWVSRWWPSGRAEIGESRDLAWAAAVARVTRGAAVAIDYWHTVTSRRPTLTGYRDGRQVPPVPDGSCDLTAHVALDACAAATGAQLITQREALLSLGITATLPPHVDAATLERGSQARELLDPEGLGGFGWLVQPVGVDVGWMNP
jgi:SAM-dependent MidA family methyltransferase